MKKLYPIQEKNIARKKFSRTPHGRHLEYLKTGKVRERARNKYLAKTHPELIMWQRARRRAQNNQLVFNITPADILIPNRCPYFSKRLLSINSGKQDFTPSLDRINPKKGYTSNNIEVISFKANQMKNNCDSIALKKFAKKVLSL